MPADIFAEEVSVAATTSSTPSGYQPAVLISEVQTGSVESASQEFIELYNPNEQSVDLTDWKLQYVSATATNWDKPSRSVALSGNLEAKSFYLISSSGYLSDTAQASFASGLSQTGGHLRLINGIGELQDLLGWGTAVMPAIAAAEAAGAGESMARNTDQEEQLNTGNNAEDFSVTLSPTPGAANVITTPQADTSVNRPAEALATENEAETKTYAYVEISELLPNPASPQVDAEDEFIELYNPNAFAVDLTGYILKTGLNDTYKHVFENTSLPAGQYLAVYSRDSSLTLSNTAGRARLFAPDDALIDETAVYDKAGDNQAWIFAEGSWQWTAAPTPGIGKVLSVLPAATTKKPALAKPAKAKKTTAKKTAAKKTRASAASRAGGGAVTADQQEPPSASAAKVHPFALAAVAVGAVLYACYEYRHDLANRLHRLRTNRSNRRAAGQIAAPASRHRA